MVDSPNTHGDISEFMNGCGVMSWFLSPLKTLKIKKRSAINKMKSFKMMLDI